MLRSLPFLRNRKARSRHSSSKMGRQLNRHKKDSFRRKLQVEFLENRLVLAGGPVVLMGIDAEDGGPNGHGPITTYSGLVNNVLGNVTNGGSGILVIGGGKSSDNVTQFWNNIDSLLGPVSVTYVNGANIASQSFSGFAMLAVVSDQFNTPSGGLTNAENSLLTGRKTDVANFVNAGGGLLGFSSVQLIQPYGYLGDLGSFTFAAPPQYSNITPTAAGLAAGITNSLDVCCWHDVFTSFPSFLNVLATNASTGQVAAIGGSQVVITGAAGGPYVVNEGGTVTLSGSGTGSGLTFNWDLDGDNIFGETGGAATRGNETGQNPTFSAAGLDGPSTFTVSLIVSGSTGTAPTSSATINVLNVAPANVNLSVSPNPINENSSTSLSGTFTDPGTPDTHTVVINWGDASANTTFSLGAGVLSFSGITHQYLDDGSYPGNGTASDSHTITVTVTDDDGAFGSGSTSITVNNVAPTLSNVSVTSPINENSFATLSGTITDPGTQDAFTLTVNWGEGAPQMYNLSAGTTTFSVSHQYLDDNPTATPQDTYPIAVTLKDDDGGTAPQLNPVSNGSFETGSLSSWSASVASGGSASVVTSYAAQPGSSPIYSPVNGSFFALLTGGAANVYTSISQTITVSAGQTISGWAFYDTQDYLPFLDDGAVLLEVTGPSVAATLFSASTATVGNFGQTPWTAWSYNFTTGGTYTLVARVRNTLDSILSPRLGLDFVGQDLAVTVTNAAPVITGVAATSEDENGTVTLSGTYTDVGTQDTHSLTINWGEGAPQTVVVSGGTFSVTHQYLDDNPTGTPSDVYNISVVLTDDDTGTDSDSTTTTITNVDPSIDSLAATSANENGIVTLSGTYSDVGTQDTHSISINWGEGAPQNVVVSGGSFSVTHQYLDDNPTGTPSDVYTISVVLTDDDTGADSDSTTTTITNVDPSIDSLAATSANENGIVTLSGTYGDVGTQDTHTITINWGEGAPQTVAVSGGSFSVPHQYLDDNPTGTPSDVYTISVVLTDDDTGTDSDSTTTTITNVDPSIDSLSATSANENGIVTLSGTYSDVGTQDTHTITINWGEGAPQTVVVSGGTFSVTHQYLDDNPTGTPSDVYTISVVLTDDDTGTDSDSTTTTITNVDPSIDSLAATSANENGIVTLSGTYSDVGTQDTHTITINWGEGAPQTVVVSGGTFSVTHQYLDDNPTGTPSDVYSIGVVLTDDDTGTDTDATTTTISNVAPTITSFTGPMANVVQGQLLSYSATFSDVGTLDTHTAVFNWGDATSSPGVVTESGGSGSVSGSHIYTSAGTYTITLTVTDDDTGTVSSTMQVIVSVVAIGEGCCETNALLIGGTTGDDTIRVVPQGKQTGASTDVVKVLINGQDQGTYTGFGKIVMIGQAGDDDMEIAGSIKHDACLFGEAGNDRLKGSGGNNIILGGSGDDTLLGDNNSLSLMIGGTGSDRLVGNAGSDILVAGTTDHDDNDAALCAIMAQWSSSADYNTRVAAISALLNSSTVHDDGAEDTLTGAAGLDLFFANLSGGSVLDKITDKHAAELAFDET